MGASGGGCSALSGEWVSPGFAVRRVTAWQAPSDAYLGLLAPPISLSLLAANHTTPWLQTGFSNPLRLDFWKDWLGRQAKVCVKPFLASVEVPSVTSLQSLTAAWGRDICVHSRMAKLSTR